MSDYPPEDELDDTSESAATPPRGAAPPSGTRRRIPADDLPRAYDRPALPRQSRQVGQTGRGPVNPAQAAPPVTPPVTPQAYPRKAWRDKRPRPQPAPVNKRDSGLYLPWWSLLILLVFVGCAAVGALLVANSIGSGVTPGGQTPMVIVITSTFTVGPPASQTAIPVPPTLTQPPPLPTIPPTASLPPGNFEIGSTVQVVGVDQSGLNVRSGPGTTSNVKFRASEGDRFVLKDGPQMVSSDEWWLIQDSNDPNRQGWASRRYLTAIAGGTAKP